MIIVGTNFGKESEGARIRQQFGPMSMPGGERRLNVITRARDALHLVTSLKSTEIADSVGEVCVFVRVYSLCAYKKIINSWGTNRR